MDNTICKSYASNEAYCTFNHEPDEEYFDLRQEAKKNEGVLGLEFTITEGLRRCLEDYLGKDENRASKKRKYNKSSSACEKLMASNFPMKTLVIGDWERTCNGKEELTAKIYFARRRLVWEFLDGTLKNKIEISWSDITAIQAVMPPKQPAFLNIQVGKPPSFFRELAPQPKKHSNWERVSDFTDGQASLWRTHLVIFRPGALDKHYEKLLQCDQKLMDLSKRPFPYRQSPYFDPTVSQPLPMPMPFPDDQSPYCNTPTVSQPLPMPMPMPMTFPDDQSPYFNTPTVSQSLVMPMTFPDDQSPYFNTSTVSIPMTFPDHQSPYFNTPTVSQSLAMPMPMPMTFPDDQSPYFNTSTVSQSLPMPMPMPFPDHQSPYFNTHTVSQMPISFTDHQSSYFNTDVSHPLPLPMPMPSYYNTDLSHQLPMPMPMPSYFNTDVSRPLPLPMPQGRITDEGIQAVSFAQP